MTGRHAPVPTLQQRLYWPTVVACATVGIAGLTGMAHGVAPKIAADTSLSTFPEQVAEPSAHGGPLAPMSIGVVEDTTNAVSSPVPTRNLRTVNASIPNYPATTEALTATAAPSSATPAAATATPAPSTTPLTTTTAAATTTTPPTTTAPATTATPTPTTPEATTTSATTTATSTTSTPEETP